MPDRTMTFDAVTALYAAHHSDRALLERIKEVNAVHLLR